MKDMPKATEQKIVEALEKAVKMANDGSTPDDALTKVANDYEFQPEIIKRMVEAFNVSKTLSHLKHANEDTRADTFPIASIENILGALYPAEPETPATKAASALNPLYEGGQRVNFMEMSKEAKVEELPPLTDKKAAAYDRDPEATAKSAIQEHEKIEKLHKQALEAYHHVYMRFFDTLDKAAAYWRSTSNKEPFALVEKRAVATFGPLGKIAMDMVYEHGNLGQDKLHVKRAADEDLGAQQMFYDDTAEPYDKVAEAVFLSQQIDRLLKEAAAINHVKHQHAMLNLSCLPPQPVLAAISYGLDGYAKEAALVEDNREEHVRQIYNALMAKAAKKKYKRKGESTDDCISRKISLNRDHGMPQDQAVAAAHSMCGASEKKSHDLDDLFVKE